VNVWLVPTVVRNRLRGLGRGASQVTAPEAGFDREARELWLSTLSVVFGVLGMRLNRG